MAVAGGSLTYAEFALEHLDEESRLAAKNDLVDVICIIGNVKNEVRMQLVADIFGHGECPKRVTVYLVNTSGNPVRKVAMAAALTFLLVSRKTAAACW